MALRVTRHDASPERQVVVGMLINKEVLGAIAGQWVEPGLFASKWSNVLGGWAVKHYTQYHEAPKGAIAQYFREWVETANDPATVELVESLLVSLSDEAARLKAQLEPDHLIDIAAVLVEKVNIRRTIEAAAAYLDAGQPDKARAALEKSRKTEIGLDNGIDALAGPAADSLYERAIEHATERIIEYPDALGNFFGDSLYRGAFVAFWGKPKIGKSYIIQDLMWQAIEQGRNVAYFECGDSTEIELFQRFASRTCRRPIAAEPYHVPTAIETFANTRKVPDVQQERYETKGKMTPGEERRARHQLFDPGRLRVSCHPSASISVNGIEGILDRWAREGWHPSVCLVDYADILAPIDRHLDKRDQVNQTWIALRGLSQRRHCLVGTLSQIKADGYNEWLMDRSAFADDSRKLAHVTSVYGINQTPAEKEVGVYRLNYVEGRGLKFFSEKKCVYTAGCLSIARPFMLSSF
jgi:hypothetical protein